MWPRVPREWRGPNALAGLFVVPRVVVVAYPSLSGLRTTGESAARVFLLFWLLIVVAGATALLLRSIAAWWILVIWELLGIALWASKAARHGLGVHLVVSGGLGFAS